MESRTDAVYGSIFDLCVAIRDYSGTAMDADVVRPWIGAHAPAARDWLCAFSERPGAPIPPAELRELWLLYALSRVMDMSLLAYQPGPLVAARWRGPLVEPPSSAALFDALGMTRITRREFHPFWLEVVEVDESPDPDEPPVVTDVVWPGWTVGPLLLSRAGCRVRAGANHIVKAIAELSTLYWAYVRANRLTQDRSVGWGHNSQWRTEFRRDYAFGGELHYNVDAEPDDDDLDDEDDPLTPDEVAELVRHRCFVRCAKDDRDRYPYEYRYVERCG